MMGEKLTIEIIKKKYEEGINEYKLPPDTTIFRYMDFSKLIGLLENKSLYLTRADRFEDPLEGHLPDWYIKKRFISHSLFSDESVESRYNDHRESFIRIIEDLRRRTFISCWNKGKEESYALWQIYAKNHGVAIKTTVRKLNKVIKGTNAKVSNVKYINDEEEHIVFPDVDGNKFNTYLRNYFVCKNKHYFYENEVRVILIDDNNEVDPIKINRISNLIEEIYVSPFSEDWFVDLVKKIVQDRYGLKNIKVIKSKVQLNIQKK